MFAWDTNFSAKLRPNFLTGLVNAIPGLRAQGPSNIAISGEIARSHPNPNVYSEAFIDELAKAANADPVEFRLRMIRASSDDDSQFRRARSIATIEAAAEAYGWDTRPSPRPASDENILTGRGVAYCYRGRLARG
ncbi:MAG: molybdopterin-dependent oxidoreductase [Planctomycetes bacterium]|nr:molybdopterin-dependent oxidoreductase [Planctomycetota bacterium]